MAPRAKRQPRVEPTFGNSGSSLLDLRLSPQDRPAAPASKSSGKGKTRKAPAKKKPASSTRKTAKNGNGNGRGNGRGGGRSGAKRRKAKRKNRFQAPTAFGRLLKRGFYWSMVLGIWGTIAVVFTNSDASFGTQLYSIVVVGIFCLVVSAVLWFILKAVMGLRVSEEDEITGLDMAELGMEAYPEFAKG